MDNIYYYLFKLCLHVSGIVTCIVSKKSLTTNFLEVFVSWAIWNHDSAQVAI